MRNLLASLRPRNRILQPAAAVSDPGRAP